VNLARDSSDETDFLAAMGALVNVRSALYTAAMRAQGPAARTEPCDGAVLVFKSNFVADETMAFVAALSEVAFGRPGDIRITSLRQGSTVLELAFTSLATVAGLLGALNLLVSQAGTLVRGLTELRKDLKHALASKPSHSARSTSLTQAEHKKALPPKVPAILNPADAFPQLIYVRRAVERDGDILVMFDEDVEVTLVRAGQKPKRRRKQV
jgi:hypothetical protein